MLGSQQCLVSLLLSSCRDQDCLHTHLAVHIVACLNTKTPPCRQQQPPGSSRGLLQPSRGRLAEDLKHLQHQQEEVLLILRGHQQLLQTLVRRKAGALRLAQPLPAAAHGLQLPSHGSG